MRSRLLLALGSSLLVGIAGVARADATPSEVSLRAEMAALRAELNQLKAQQDDAYLKQRRAEEFKAMVQDVMADAETRASLLENGMTAGHNGEHFFLASDNGEFRMEISGQIQIRHITNTQDTDDEPSSSDLDFEGVPSGFVVSPDEDDNERGFEVRRAKIQFAGHIADPRLNYAIRLAVDHRDNSLSADRIVISYALTDNLTLWGGEDKGPLLREELTDSSHQLAVERTLVNEIFTIDYVQGVGIKWDVDESIKVHVMINDGSRSGKGSTDPNPLTQSGASQTPVDDEGFPLEDEGPSGCASDFDEDGEPIGSFDCSRSDVSKAYDEDRSDFAITARIDVRLEGVWSQMDDFTAGVGEDTAIFIGAAIHYEAGETGDSAFNNNFLIWTVDGSFEHEGWNFYAAVMGMHTDLEDTSAVAGTDQDLYGIIVQGGYRFPDSKWEPFVRWEYLDFDQGFTDEFDNNYGETNIITFGVNHYFHGHDAKMTLDVVYALDPIPVADGGLGLQVDGHDDDGQVVIRGQFQLLF